MKRVSKSRGRGPSKRRRITKQEAIQKFLDYYYSGNATYQRGPRKGKKIYKNKTIAHRAAIRDAVRVKNKPFIFDLDDPRADAYIRGKNGPRTYDIVGVDAFPKGQPLPSWLKSKRASKGKRKTQPYELKNLSKGRKTVIRNKKSRRRSRR